VTEGELLSFTVTATDADSDPLTLNTTNLPAGVTVTDNGGGSWTVEWTPDANDVGSHSDMVFEVSDGQETDDETISITVQAQNGGGTGFQQSGDTQGILSIEAEHYQRKTAATDGHEWVTNTQNGYSGSGAMQALPEDYVNRSNDYATASPTMEYDALFQHSGPHKVWVRGWAASNSSDSVYVGLNGIASTAIRYNAFDPSGQWVWEGSKVLDVQTTGQHTISIWMRESGMIVDKIVLTPDIAYNLTGKGPAESPFIGGPTISLDDIFPHRGGSMEHPENTMSAFNANLSRGISLDMDIRKTGDGDIVVIHDANTNRTTNASLVVATSTVTQLQALDAAYYFDPGNTGNYPQRGQGVTIPTLDQVFVAFAQNSSSAQSMWIDTKDDETYPLSENMQDLYPRLISLIGTYNLWDQAFVEVRGEMEAEVLRTLDPRVQLVYWGGTAQLVRNALTYPHYRRIGTRLSVAPEVAAEVRNAGREFHITENHFTQAELDDALLLQPTSLGTNSYSHLIQLLGLN